MNEMSKDNKLKKANINEYIKINFEKCVRKNPNDKGTLLGIPYPYTVPSTETFDELYYWDTYFTNIGLLKIGKATLAKNNVDNMLYLVDKYGLVPNGNRTNFLINSQPPFLSEMVKDIYNYFKDRVWLTGAYFALLKEYDFWMSKRISTIGLNCYNPEVPNEREEEFKDYFIERIGFRPDEDDSAIARHALASGECGWDMNPRFEFEAYNYAAIDLNSLLYGFENNMAIFADILGNGDTAKWKHRAGRRLMMMNKYMLNGNLFADYNYVKNKHSSVFSAASYFTMFNRVATEEQAKALVDNLPRIEEAYGISTCENKNRNIRYQWDYPNGWACLQYIMIRALDNYGYYSDALRIAEKYVKLTEKVFDETHNFWEKYNVVEGNINVSNEYKMPTMLGWSAGIYIFAKDYCDNYAPQS